MWAGDPPGRRVAVEVTSCFERLLCGDAGSTTVCEASGPVPTRHAVRPRCTAQPPAPASLVSWEAAFSVCASGVLIVVVLFIVLRLDIPQLVALALLCVVYVVVQECFYSQRLPGSSGCCSHKAAGVSAVGLPASGPRNMGNATVVAGRPPKQESKVPVLVANFSSQTLQGQVSELLEQITPSPSSDEAVKKLADRARNTIHLVFPEVEVVGIASGDIVRGTAFGVAVPELDLVALAAPHELMQQLHARLTKGGMPVTKLDARKLQKSAIRVCTDQLVSVGGFRFRRSAFRCEEPKVTLMAPPPADGFSTSIPVDFSVNCVTPLCNAALVAECGQIDVRAKLLILIVRRWSKDRGICHAAKGHLAPYAWTVLAIYFLQVGFPDVPLLPPLRGYRMVHNKMVVQRVEGGDSERWSPPGGMYSPESLPVSELFRAFVRFYAKDVDFASEFISTRRGSRFSGHKVLTPLIEDPFDQARNLAVGVPAVARGRLEEEFERAHVIFERGGLLSELLEPWAPSEGVQGEPEGANVEEHVVEEGGR